MKLLDFFGVFKILGQSVLNIFALYISNLQSEI